MNDRAKSIVMGEGGRTAPRPGRNADLTADELPEDAFCPSCGAVYRARRWQWLVHCAHAALVVCAACRRTADMRPAAYVYIDGLFADDHLVDVLELVRREETIVRMANPMQRIMSIDEHGGTTIVATTGIYLAHVIGAALSVAWEGALQIKSGCNGDPVRIYWHR